MKKIYKKILLIISCFVMIICSLSFINVSTNNNNGVRYESNRRYMQPGTVVPSSGYIENIYFNTKMLPSNILDILSKLTYISGVPFGFPDYVDVAIIFVTSDLNSLVIVERITREDTSYRYELGHLVDQSTFNNIWSSVFAEDDNDGWYTNYSYNPLVVNNENVLNILSTQLGLVVQNEELKNLISITPFVDDVVEDTIISDLLSSIGLGITSIVGVVVNGIKESFLELVYVDKDSDNLVVSDLAYFLFAMLGFSISVGLIWLVIFMFKRRE